MTTTTATRPVLAKMRQLGDAPVQMVCFPIGAVQRDGFVKWYRENAELILLANPDSCLARALSRDAVQEMMRWIDPLYDTRPEGEVAPSIPWNHQFNLPANETVKAFYDYACVLEKRKPPPVTAEALSIPKESFAAIADPRTPAEVVAEKVTSFLKSLEPLDDEQCSIYLKRCAKAGAVRQAHECLAHALERGDEVKTSAALQLVLEFVVYGASAAPAYLQSTRAWMLTSCLTKFGTHHEEICLRVYSIILYAVRDEDVVENESANLAATGFVKAIVQTMRAWWNKNPRVFRIGCEFLTMLGSYEEIQEVLAEEGFVELLNTASLRYSRGGANYIPAVMEGIALVMGIVFDENFVRYLLDSGFLRRILEDYVLGYQEVLAATQGVSMVFVSDLTVGDAHVAFKELTRHPSYVYEAMRCVKTYITMMTLSEIAELRSVMFDTGAAQAMIKVLSLMVENRLQMPREEILEICTTLIVHLICDKNDPRTDAIAQALIDEGAPRVSNWIARMCIEEQRVGMGACVVMLMFFRFRAFAFDSPKQGEEMKEMFVTVERCFLMACDRGWKREMFYICSSLETAIHKQLTFLTTAKDASLVPLCQTIAERRELVSKVFEVANCMANKHYFNNVPDEEDSSSRNTHERGLCKLVVAILAALTYIPDMWEYVVEKGTGPLILAISGMLRHPFDVNFDYSLYDVVLIGVCGRSPHFSNRWGELGLYDAVMKSFVRNRRQQPTTVPEERLRSELLALQAIAFTSRANQRRFIRNQDFCARLAELVTTTKSSSRSSREMDEDAFGFWCLLMESLTASHREGRKRFEALGVRDAVTRVMKRHPGGKEEVWGRRLLRRWGE